MKDETAALNTLWAHLTVEELIRLGVNYFCLSPGSRCTPLTVAAARHPRAKTVVCHDERGAAFHALGYAKGSGKPAVMITTSGTAIAHAFPAVIEAKSSGIPLILISADRPAELRGTGANQTIDQIKLFGAYVRHFVDMPCPDRAVGTPFLLSSLDHAVHRALSHPRGPVHLNFQYRKPLDPTAKVPEARELATRTWLAGQKPFTLLPKGEMRVPWDQIQQLAAQLQGAKSGLLVVGSLASEQQRQAVIKLSARLQWPVHGDITSGLRLGCDCAELIPYFDQLLLSDALSKAFSPDVVLHIGGPIVSKRISQKLNQGSDLLFVVLDEKAERYDPNQLGGMRLESDIVATCLELLDALPREVQTADPWLSKMRILSQVVGMHCRLMSTIGLETVDFSEISVAQVLSSYISDKCSLFISASLPVRDLDMYGLAEGNNGSVSANRGASGIDGVLACASGYAVGQNKKTLLSIGDVAALHDLSSFGILAQESPDLIVVIINNGGGGIFEFLPIHGAAGDVFDKHFKTPSSIDFASVATAFSLDFKRVEDEASLCTALDRAMERAGPCLIEVKVQSVDNKAKHQSLQNSLKTLVDEAVLQGLS